MAFVLGVHAKASAPVVSTAPAVTSGIDTTGADLLVVHAAALSAVSIAITDSKGNTWTALTDQDEGFSGHSRFFYSKNPTVGTAHTFTNTSSYASLCVAAFSGADTTAPFDVENGFQGTLTTVQPGSVTPGVDNELVVTGLAMYTPQTFTINSSMTIIEQQIGTAISIGSSLAYIVQGTLAAINPTWSWDGSNLHLSTEIATFKAAAAVADTLLAQACL